jgi:hypothetical protein
MFVDVIGTTSPVAGCRAKVYDPDLLHPRLCNAVSYRLVTA